MATAIDQPDAELGVVDEEQAVAADRRSNWVRLKDETAIVGGLYLRFVSLRRLRVPNEY